MSVLAAASGARTVAPRRCSSSGPPQGPTNSSAMWAYHRGMPSLSDICASASSRLARGVTRRFTLHALAPVSSYTVGSSIACRGARVTMAWLPRARGSGRAESAQMRLLDLEAVRGQSGAPASPPRQQPVISQSTPARASRSSSLASRRPVCSSLPQLRSLVQHRGQPPLRRCLALRRAP